MSRPAVKIDAAGVRAFLEHRRPEWPSVNTHAKEHEHVKV